MNIQPFNAYTAATVNIVVAAASANVSLGIPGGGYKQIRVCNNGSATVWVAFGSSAVTASLAADIPIPPGTVEVLTLPASVTHAAAIAAGATGTIYFTPGSGI